MKPHLLFLVLSIIPPLTAMEISGIEKAVTVAFLKKRVAIGGDNGCAIFDAYSGILLHQLTHKKTYQIAATRDKKTLAVLDDKELTVFNAETGHKKLFTHHTSLAAVTFNGDDVLFTYISGQLKSYNCTTKICLSVNTLAWEPGTTPITTISCHPTKNEIIYPSKSNRLSIAQPGCSPLIKTHLQPTNLYYCQAGQYSPDGKHIAINEHTEKVFIYDKNQNICFQLCHDNKQYIAMAFHPHSSIIALLTRNSAIHYFNYKTGRLIAATHPLNIPVRDIYKPFHNRLAFSDTGAQLVAAPLGQGSFIINIPSNNLMLICYALHFCGGLPKDLMRLILGITMQHNTFPSPYFSYLDYAEFMFIEPIDPSNEQESPMELEETEVKNFTAIDK